MSTRSRMLFLLAFLAAVPLGFTLVAVLRHQTLGGLRPSIRTEIGLIELPARPRASI